MSSLNVRILDADLQRLASNFHSDNEVLDRSFEGCCNMNCQMFLSNILLVDCIDRIKAMRNTFIGFTYITLSSTREGYRLYKRNHFEELEEDMIILVEKSDLSSAIPMYYTFDLEE